MKTKIAVGLKGFVYMPIKQKELSKSEKRNLRLDILEHKRALNLKLLNSSSGVFIK